MKLTIGHALRGCSSLTSSYGKLRSPHSPQTDGDSQYNFQNFSEEFNGWFEENNEYVLGEEQWEIISNEYRFTRYNNVIDWINYDSPLFDSSIFYREREEEMERQRIEEEEKAQRYVQDQEQKRKEEEERSRLEEEERQQKIAEKIKLFKKQREEITKAQQIRRMERTESLKRQQQELESRVQAWISAQKQGMSQKERKSSKTAETLENLRQIRMNTRLGSLKTDERAAPSSNPCSAPSSPEEESRRQMRDKIRELLEEHAKIDPYEASELEDNELVDQLLLEETETILRQEELDQEMEMQEEARILQEEENRIRMQQEQEEELQKAQKAKPIMSIVEIEQQRKLQQQKEVAAMYNRIASGDTDYTVQMLRSNSPNLTKLDFKFIELNLEDFKKICDALISNRIVKEFDLTLNATLNDTFIDALCEVVTKNKVITRFYLEETSIKHHEKLLAAMEKNDTIIDMTLSPDATIDDRDRLDMILLRNDEKRKTSLKQTIA
jgi:hypothetical protein